MPRGGARPGAGRKPGTKEKQKITRDRRAVKDAVSSVSVPAVENSKGKGPIESRAGISPKDLMLDSMRQAWDAAHALDEVVKDLSRDVKLLEAVPRGAPLSNVKRLVELLEIPVGTVVADNVVDAKLDELRARLVALKQASSSQAEQAIELAVKVAPYEHAKLANIDGKMIGDIHLHVKKY